MKNLRYEWPYDGYPGTAVVHFDLSDLENGTALTVTFTVVEEFPDDVPEFKRQSAVEGWNFLIKDSLKIIQDRKL